MTPTFRITRRLWLAGAALAGSGMARIATAAATRSRPANAGPATATSLESGFRSPPPAARPRTWWHWMNGNVTEHGIAEDLAWMRRIGIGGVHVFDAALDTPRIVERPVKYMSKEWRRAFRRSAAILDHQGMEMGIAASPGWSETGGPWVEPQDAMKKLVWTEAVVEGGKASRLTLVEPPSVPGVYQDIPIPPPPVGEAPPTPPQLFRDVAVFAYPERAGARAGVDATYADLAGRVVEAPFLGQEGYASAVEIPAGAGSGVVADFGRIRTFTSVEFFIQNDYNIFFGSPLRPVLEASADGKAWRRVSDVVICAAPTTVSFAPVAARYARVRFPTGPDPVLPPPISVSLAHLRFLAQPRINCFEAKAAFSILRSYYDLDGDVGPDVPGFEPDAVIDLTARMSAGVLDWTPPPGRWRVVRLGFSLTGRQNHPAVPEATGLEVDKYDGRAVRAYIERYLDMYADAAGHGLFGGRGLQALLTDSTEVGASNWTPDLLAQFEKRRGYDPRPWLPTLTGVIVGSRARSDGFLYDYRRTLSELMADEHYGTIAEAGRRRGLFVYAESLEAGRPTLGDDLDMRRFADIPMAALWAWDRTETGTRPALIADCKGASSVAHLYGQNVTAAESMTSGNSLYAQSPSDLKRVLDLEFALGVNRIVIHTSPHQPVDYWKPGLSLQVFGQAFTRHNTWAEMAGPWIDYMARSAFLLQQGINVADVAYFYGEDGSPTALFQKHPVTDAPTRHAFDYVGALPLATIAGVEDGELVFPSGARHKALYLGGSSSRMTLPTLRRLQALVQAGLTVIGTAPVSTPSGADDAAEFARLAAAMWRPGVETPVGRGRTIAMSDVEAALARIGVPHDFAADPPAVQADLMFVHRRTDEGELYFVANRVNRAAKVSARFRVTGRPPEMWRADTGEIRPLSYRVDGPHTVFELDLAPEDAFFVVFRGRSETTSRVVPASEPVIVAAFDGPWKVGFEAGRGAPADIEMPSLTPLDQAADAGIRYFSGIAEYEASIQAPAGWRRGDDLVLDLGAVGEVAEVRVNGSLLATLWKTPYRVDVGKHWRTGANRVQVRVANLWLNRLIGDLQPGAERVAWVSNYTMTAATPLRPSGLIGPVRLLSRPTS